MALADIGVKVLTIFGSRSLATILTGAGLGLATSQFILTILNRYIDYAVNQMSGISVIGLLGLCGFDQALSIIIAALVMRATIQSQSISLVKKTTV